MDKILLLILSPLFVLYGVLCLISFFLRYPFTLKSTNGNIDLFVIKDAIHSDFMIESKHLNISTDMQYTMFGWGDKRIFLEIQSWNELKAIDFIKAFFGLNQTVVRIEHINETPKKKIKKYKINENQLNILKKYVDSSISDLQPIEKKKTDYQNGTYFKSNLKYNCINTCNNWVNLGLRKIGISNKIWCPLSLWI